MGDCFIVRDQLRYTLSFHRNVRVSSVKSYLTAETIQERKLFKGGNYSRKYGICEFGLEFEDI